MLSWKLTFLFFTSSNFMKHSLFVPTVTGQFCKLETDWRVRREQSTPVLNKILDKFMKQSH